MLLLLLGVLLFALGVLLGNHIWLGVYLPYPRIAITVIVPGIPYLSCLMCCIIHEPWPFLSSFSLNQLDLGINFVSHSGFIMIFTKSGGVLNHDICLTLRLLPIHIEQGTPPVLLVPWATSVLMVPFGQRVIEGIVVIHVLRDLIGLIVVNGSRYMIRYRYDLNIGILFVINLALRCLSLLRTRLFERIALPVLLAWLFVTLLVD